MQTVHIIFSGRENKENHILDQKCPEVKRHSGFWRDQGSRAKAIPMDAPDSVVRIF